MPDELKNTQAGYLSTYILNAASSMMNLRLAEIIYKAGCSYHSASAYDGDYFVGKTRRVGQPPAVRNINWRGLAAMVTLNRTGTPTWIYGIGIRGRRAQHPEPLRGGVQQPRQTTKLFLFARVRAGVHRRELHPGDRVRIPVPPSSGSTNTGGGNQPNPSTVAGR